MSYLRRHKWIGAVGLAGLCLVFLAGTAAPGVEPARKSEVTAANASVVVTNAPVVRPEGYLWSRSAEEDEGYTWSQSYGAGEAALPAVQGPTPDLISAWGYDE